MNRLPKILNPLRLQLGITDGVTDTETLGISTSLRQSLDTTLSSGRNPTLSSGRNPGHQSSLGIASSKQLSSNVLPIKTNQPENLSGITLSITQHKRQGLDGEIRAQYSTLVATLFAAISPALSRHLIWNAASTVAQLPHISQQSRAMKKVSSDACLSCGVVLVPGVSCNVKINPITSRNQRKRAKCKSKRREDESCFGLQRNSNKIPTAEIVTKCICGGKKISVCTDIGKSKEKLDTKNTIGLGSQGTDKADLKDETVTGDSNSIKSIDTRLKLIPDELDFSFKNLNEEIVMPFKKKRKQTEGNVLPSEVNSKRKRHKTASASCVINTEHRSSRQALESTRCEQDSKKSSVSSMLDDLFGSD